MKKIYGLLFAYILGVTIGCDSKNSNQKLKNEVVGAIEIQKDTLTSFLKMLNPELPTIGLLMYNGVLQSEVIAASDVFSKPTSKGKSLFNVVTIAETNQAITTEEGMRFLPDYTFTSCPKLTALFVPSAYDMYTQVHNQSIISFIQEKNKETNFMVSNCAGAQLIGASGIADDHKIVTWIGGGTQLQLDYPNLNVQNDSVVTFISDGKFSSSNGNLTSYISALELLEKMTNTEHRNFVESYLYLNRLQNWKKEYLTKE